MVRTLTTLAVALAFCFGASQAVAASTCSPGSACPSVKKTAAATHDHNTQPLGGAADEAKKADKKAAACCGVDGCAHAKAKADKKAAACCGVAGCAHAKAKGEKKEACVAAGCSASECGENCKMALGGSDDKKADKDKAADKKADKADKNDAEHAGKHRAYKVGDAVKSFEATNAKTGKVVSVDSLKGEKATVLIFWNQDCPFVVEMQDRAVEFAKAHKDKGVNVVALDAGVNNAVDAIEKYAADKPFPVLVNRDTKLAAQFGATHTPEVFVLDKKGVIQYHGAFDSGRLRGEQDTRKTYVEDAVKSIVKGEKPEVASTRAFGCSLKYADGVKPLTR